MPTWKPNRCSDVRSTKLDWLWPGYLPRGKLALLDGDPEMGKSLLTIDLVARLSRGGPLPDGAPVTHPCTSVLLSVEDDAADTIRPRAEAAGADLSRLVLPDFGGRGPRFPDDLPALEELIVESGADLVVIDPLMAFLPPRVAANLDQCVRQALTPLANLAAWTGCAILLVRHLTKQVRERAVHRGQGSMGIMAAVRTALFVAPHPGRDAGPGDPSVEPPAPAADCVFAVAKNNIGTRPPAIGYRVVGSPAGPPVIEWAGPVDLTADALGRKKARPLAVLKARERAVAWLRRELADGPRKAGEVYAAAAEAGIPDRTLIRAKADLPARSHRDYNWKKETSVWYWFDPSAPWPKKAPFARPAEGPPHPWEVS